MEAREHDDVTIADVMVMTVRAQLPAPVRFGSWYMPHREFALVVVRTESGVVGASFTLTRDGPVAACVRDLIAPMYRGRTLAPEAIFGDVRRSSLANFSGGVGLRSLSLVDLACWDALARDRGMPIGRLLGAEPTPMPATLIIGYPPTIGPDEVASQVAEHLAAGWRRFKLPVAADRGLTIARARAAIDAAQGATVSMDGAWIFDDVEDAVQLIEALDRRLGWFEDVFPPGEADKVAALRRAVDTPIAMGDEQGGAYYPDALLAQEAVDVIRLDLTTMGGISGSRRVVDLAHSAGVRVEPHMNGHVHAQVLPAWGLGESSIEWGIPWSGVDPWADSLRQPVVVDGLMQPLADEPGFGPLVHPDWVRTQPFDDPEGVLDLVEGADPTTTTNRG